MRFQQVGDNAYILRLYSGEPIVESLTAFLGKLGAGLASISAIGAVEWAELAYWNAQTKEYEHRRFDEQMEVVSLGGDCSLKEDETGQSKPFLHVHCVLSRR